MQKEEEGKRRKKASPEEEKEECPGHVPRRKGILDNSGRILAVGERKCSDQIK